MTVEEIKVKFTANVDNFKKGLDSVKSSLSKTSSAMDGLAGDIKRASESSNKDVNKIGQALEKEKQKFDKASESAKKYGQDVQNIGSKMQNTANKLNDIGSAISRQEGKVKSLKNDYEAMSNAMKDFNIKGSINEELDSMEMKFAKNKQKALELERAMQDLSNSPYDLGEWDGTYMTMNQMQAALNRLDVQSEQTYNRLQRLKSAMAGVSDKSLDLGNTAGLKRMQSDIAGAESKLATLKGQEASTGSTLSNLAQRQANANARFEQSKSAMAGAGSKISELRGSLGSLSSSNAGGFMAGLSGKVKKMGNAMSSMVHKFKNGVSKVKEFGQKAWDTGKKVVNFAGKISILGRAASGLKNKLSGFGAKFAQNMQMVKSIVLSMALMQLFSNIGETLTNFAGYSDRTNKSLSQLQSSFSYLKRAMVSAFEPLLSVVAPMISSVINMLADGLNKIAEFFAALAGQKTFTKAVYVQKDYAASVDDTASSTNQATQANEKYKKSVLGFDEITKLDDNSSTGTNGSSGGGSGGGATNGDAGGWTTQAVDMKSNLIDAIKDGDWYKVGEEVGKKINEALESIDWDSVKSKVNKCAENIAKFLNGAMKTIDWDLVGFSIGEGINTILGGLDTFITTFDWAYLGKSMAKMMNKMIKTIDWDLLGKTLGDSIQAPITTAFNFVENFDFKALGAGLAKAVNSCFKAIDFSMAGKTLGDALIGVLDTITTFLDDVDWDKIGKDIVDFICAIDWIGLIFSALSALMSAGKAVADFVLGIVEAIGEHIVKTDWGKVASDIWKGLKDAFKKGSENFLEVSFRLIGDLKKAWDVLCKGVDCAVDAGVSLVKSGWKSLSDWVGDKVDALVSLAKSGWSSLKDWVGDKVQAGVSLVKSGWSSLKGFVGGAVTVTVNAVKGAWSAVKEWAGLAGAKVQKTLTTAKGAWSSITTAWSGFRNGAAKKALSTAKAGWSSITSSWQKLKNSNALKRLKTSISGWGSTVKKWIALKGGNLLKTLKTYVKLPKISWASKQFKAGPVKINYPWPSLSWVKFAKGGFPNRGQMFIANEAGPEMVGTMDGKTSVANNNQIVSGIKAGVYQAMVQAGKSNGNGQKESTFNIYVGGRQITDVVVKDINNRTIATGKSPILV